MKKKLLILIFISTSLSVFGQKSDKLASVFADPIIVDSSSTLMIPIRYNTDIFSSSKISLRNECYANIIFYDFKSDTYKKLFKDDTFIKGFGNNYHSYHRYEKSNRSGFISAKWIFYFVITGDYDKDGKIDNDDPSILFVSDKYGNELKSITPTDENAVSIDIFDKQGFALIKMQRDLDKDNDFESDDTDYYYIRLDLNALSLGNKIEINK